MALTALTGFRVPVSALHSPSPSRSPSPTQVLAPVAALVQRFSSVAASCQERSVARLGKKVAATRNFSLEKSDKASVKLAGPVTSSTLALSDFSNEKGAIRGRLDDPLTEAILGACIEVHGQLGPGLLESVYEQCLCRELALRNIPFERQRSVPIRYKGISISGGLRTDLIVFRHILVELKAVDRILPVHLAQAMTYLKLVPLQIGLLVNFNHLTLREGIRRLTNRSAPLNLLSSSSPCSRQR